MSSVVVPRCEPPSSDSVTLEFGSPDLCRVCYDRPPSDFARRCPCKDASCVECFQEEMDRMEFPMCSVCKHPIVWDGSVVWERRSPRWRMDIVDVDPSPSTPPCCWGGSRMVWLIALQSVEWCTIISAFVVIARGDASWGETRVILWTLAALLIVVDLVQIGITVTSPAARHFRSMAMCCGAFFAILCWARFSAYFWAAIQSETLTQYLYFQLFITCQLASYTCSLICVWMVCKRYDSD